MKLRMIGVGVIALLILGIVLFPPQRLPQEPSDADVDPATTAASSGESRTSSKRRVVEKDHLSQEELAKQFILNADRLIAEKEVSYSLFAMLDSPSDNLLKLVEQMDRKTVLQLLEHYDQWDKDIYQCGVACHLLSRLAQLAPEEALSLYDQKIGLNKVKEIFKLSDEEEEEDLEKNAKAIPTLSLMALASGYQVGKPGSRQLFTAIKQTIPWKEITRAMAEDEEALVGENGLLCMMIFLGMISEECKAQPEFALAELRALPISDAMKMNFLSDLVKEGDIAFRSLQTDVEAYITTGDTANDEQQQLAISFATRIFGESPYEAEQWLTQHKLPLKERSAHELDTLLEEWTTDNHATFQSWAKQLDSDLRPQIAAQKMEQLCVTLSNHNPEQPKMEQEWQMLDSLVPHVSSLQLLQVIKNAAKRNHSDDVTAFRALLHHLKIPEAEVQTLLEAKNKSE